MLDDFQFDSRRLDATGLAVYLVMSHHSVMLPMSWKSGCALVGTAPFETINKPQKKESEFLIKACCSLFLLRE